MPELPEVEIIVRRLRKIFIGKRVKSVLLYGIKARLSSEQKKALTSIKGENIKSIERKGKAILIFFERSAIIIHLRINGQVCISQTIPANVIFGVEFEDEPYGLYVCDPRRLATVEWVDDISNHKFLSGLGPDALSEAFSEEYFLNNIKRYKKPIKVLLMEQSFVSGIGNIYAVEALFRAGIRPDRPANSISKDEAKRLYKAIKDVLSESIGTCSVPAKYFIDKSKMGNTHAKNYEFFVYGKANKPCLRCGNKISKTTISGRGTYFCPVCQR